MAGWVSVGPSVGCFVVVLAAAGAPFAPEAQRRRHTSHHAPATTLAFLDDGVLLTAVLCTSLHSLWARGCVASAAAVAVKRWWKLEASCSNSHQQQQQQQQAPDQQKKIFLFFFPTRHFFFFPL